MWAHWSSPWHRAGAALLIPGVALLAWVNFLNNGQPEIASTIAGWLMIAGATLVLIGRLQAAAARKNASPE